MPADAPADLRVDTLRIEHVDPVSLVPAPYNPRKMGADERRRLERGIKEFGLVDPIVARREDRMVIGGHQRLDIARTLGYVTVPVVFLDGITDARAKALNVLLNNPSVQGVFDMPKLSELLLDLDGIGFDATLTGFDRDELADLLTWTPEPEGNSSAVARKTLAARFGVPPFSVLDARQGYWQDRKRAWIALGIRGELGREGNVLVEHGASGSGNKGALRMEPAGKKRGQTYGTEAARGNGSMIAQTFGDGHRAIPGGGTGPNSAWKFRGADGYAAGAAAQAEGSGTSVFDPVLAELVCRWFTPDGGHVLDPFAGEATKGIVAAYLGYQYTGVELRPEQVDANVRQAAIVGVTPTWLVGDSAHLSTILPPDTLYDLVFTSPPYYDLEVYSAQQADGSAIETYAQFLTWYRAIFAAAVSRLRDNRFVVVKVGEIRDKKTGAYHNFVSDTVRCFVDAGLSFYDDLVLVTSVGSLPVRVGSQFTASRKIGKTHQNVLVFYKGDVRKIGAHFSREIQVGSIDVSDAQADSG